MRGEWAVNEPGVSAFDQGGYDSLIADTRFSITELIQKKRVEPHWINLYGVAENVDLAELREKMPHATLDTCYKGRLLVGMSVEEARGRRYSPQAGAFFVRGRALP